MKTNIEESWEKFLNPEILKQHLLAGGIYLAAYEMFKRSLVERPRELFCRGYKDGKDIVDPRYQVEVLSLSPRHVYHASSLWWKKQGVFSEEDVALAKEIRVHRDEIAHDIPRFLGTADGVIRIELLDSIFVLLSKIDKWWILEIEVPGNPDFDDVQLSQEDLEKAMSGSMIFLSLMIPIAFGDDSHLRAVYEIWKERRKVNK